MLSPVRGNSWAVRGTKWDRCKWVWTVQLFTTVSALTLSCIITFIIHTVTAFYFLPTFLLNGIYIICKNPHQEVQCYSTVYFIFQLQFTFSIILYQFQVYDIVVPQPYFTKCPPPVLPAPTWLHAQWLQCHWLFPVLHLTSGTVCCRAIFNDHEAFCLAVVQFAHQSGPSPCCVWVFLNSFMLMV